MKRIKGLFFAVALSTAFAAFGAMNEWHQANGPLKTRWDKDVTPGKVWTEYPRPQMARKDWLNLNGLWDYAIIPTNVAMPLSYQGKIFVPFPVESALSGVMQRLDEKSHLVYRREFKIPKSWKNRRMLLHFGAVDWAARILVDGQEVGTHHGGYDPFTFNIPSPRKLGDSQEIVVDVFDPTEAGQPRGKQVRKPGGIMYTPTSGIWQTVWLEPVPETSLDELVLTPDVDRGVLKLSAKVLSAAGTEVLEVEAGDGAHRVRTNGPAGVELEIPVNQFSKVHLWTPDEPFLYDLKVKLTRNGKTLDSVKSYFGMRKISVGKDSNGVTRLLLNGQPVFQVGPLDQGFWPDGIYTPPSDAAMRYDLEMTKKLGFNMTRKHVKVEPDRWYYYCDKLGLLVWQDMPAGDNKTDADKQEFERELMNLIDTHRNHPSIVMWVVFNEAWGQFDTKQLTALVKELDPSRLADNATGWTDQQCGDVIDMHKYPGPDSPKPEESRAAVLGEFGGLGLPMPGHTWAKTTWGYKGMDSQKTLTENYVNLLTKVLELKNSAGLSAAVYTQITDVETECNGLMTYDREILKPDLAAVSSANKKLH